MNRRREVILQGLGGLCGNAQSEEREADESAESKQDVRRQNRQPFSGEPMTNNENTTVDTAATEQVESPEGSSAATGGYTAPMGKEQEYSERLRGLISEAEQSGGEPRLTSSLVSLFSGTAL